MPIGQFKAHAARWLKRAGETRQPVVITKNGKPAGVVVSPAEFDRLQERQRLMEDISAGLADLEAGRTLTSAEVRKALRLRRTRAR